MTAMPDQSINCGDCGTDFPFTERDQEFYAKQVDKKTGLAWAPPKRCRACRDLRKQGQPKQDQQRF
jgi:hypothetical protein